MGYLSNRVDQDELKPGDHIYTYRTAFTYSHHGIYVGGNKVIHFTSDLENAKLNSRWNLSSSLPIPSSCLTSVDSGFSLPESEHNCDSGSCLCTYSCGYHQPESGVTLSCLNCFTGTGSVYLYQYGVSKWMHMSRIRGGTCTVEPSNPPQDVVDRAIHLLGEPKGFGEYDVLRNNCEDFALYCKTELMTDGKLDTGASGQVNSIVNAPWKRAAVSLVSSVAYKSLKLSPVSVAVTVGQCCWERYKTDIGVRADVIQVGVEDIGSFRLDRGY